MRRIAPLRANRIRGVRSVGASVVGSSSGERRVVAPSTALVCRRGGTGRHSNPSSCWAQARESSTLSAGTATCRVDGKGTRWLGYAHLRGGEACSTTPRWAELYCSVHRVFGWSYEMIFGRTVTESSAKSK